MDSGTNPTQHTNGIGGFLKGDTAGLPNWAWILVVAAGIVAATVVTKFLNKGSSTSSTTGPDTSGTSGLANTTSGLGLAVDPTTGLPYAVSGLVPSGAMAGSTTPTQGATGPTGPPGPTGPTGTPDPYALLKSAYPWIGSIPANSTFSLGGIDTKTGDERLWYTPPGGKTAFVLMPKGSTIAKGGDGRLWLNPPGPLQGKIQGVLITAQQQGHGGGPFIGPTIVNPSWPGSGVSHIVMNAS